MVINLDTVTQKCVVCISGNVPAKIEIVVCGPCVRDLTIVLDLKPQNHLQLLVYSQRGLRTGQLR